MRSLFALAALPFAFAAPAQNKPAGLQVAGKYIVVLNPESNIRTLGLGKRGSIFETIQALHTYQLGTFKGFSASLTAEQVTDLKADPKVAYVEADGILHTQDKWMKRDGSAGAKIKNTQTGSTWGLARISHRQKASTEYLYDDTAGEGTCAYIIDTGIYTAHPDFEGRATFVKNFDTVDGSNEDLLGHGTHVAGTIGSKTYGVAKKTKLFALKTCNQYGQCALSDVNAAISEAVKDSATRACPNGVVINMSLGAPNAEWKSIADAIAQATQAGIFVAVAAGNAGDDAAGYSPASSAGVCAVGASSSSDEVAAFSNFGSTVSIIGPGVDILSLDRQGSGTATMSGTSMASPHIAGLAAYLLGNSGKQSPAALCAQIQSLATKDVLTKAIKNTKNYLAFNGAGEDSTATPAPEIPKRDEKKNSRWCWAPWCSNAGRP